jgi:hypothetical protein
LVCALAPDAATLLNFRCGIFFGICPALPHRTDLCGQSSRERFRAWWFDNIFCSCRIDYSLLGDKMTLLIRLSDSLFLLGRNHALRLHYGWRLAAGCAVEDKGAGEAHEAGETAYTSLQIQIFYHVLYNTMSAVTIKDDKFILPSGRTVQLDGLTMRHTYAGMLEGGPGVELTRHLIKNIKEDFPDTLVIMPADESFLPYLTWIAECESTTGTVTKHADYRSTLRVCWFNNRMPDNMYQEIATVLSSVDWESNAEEYNSDNW